MSDILAFLLRCAASDATQGQMRIVFTSLRLDSQTFHSLLYGLLKRPERLHLAINSRPKHPRTLEIWKRACLSQVKFEGLNLLGGLFHSYNYRLYLTDLDVTEKFQRQMDAFGSHRSEVTYSGSSDVGGGPAQVIHDRIGQFDCYEGSHCFGHRSVVVSSNNTLS